MLPAGTPTSSSTRSLTAPSSLHLNGYKIANPTVLARIPRDELQALFEGYGHRVLFVEGDEPGAMHQAMATAMDEVIDDVQRIRREARGGGGNGKKPSERPRWPMIVLRTPKGWTGPKEVDGLPTEGSWPSHQVPMADVSENREHLALLEQWLRSYRPDELFDDAGRLRADVAALAPQGDRRMTASPHANGGHLTKDLRLPDFRDYGVDVPAPATTTSEATKVLGEYLRDVIRKNPTTFRLFGPDETASNRLSAVYEATDKALDG